MSLAPSWLSNRRTEWGLIGAILLVLAATTAADPQHGYIRDPSGHATNLARQISMLGIFALGSAVVIIAGGIDLSCGSMIAFSGTVCASVMLWLAPEAMKSGRTPLGWPVITAAIGITLAVGLLVGSLHAWLINAVRLPPFVATLASLVGLRSFARAMIPNVTEATLHTYSNQIQIFDRQFRELAKSVWVPCVVFMLLAVLIGLLLSRTVAGRHLYALGGNEQAARLSGIRTERVKWLAYCVSAVCSSIAGIFYIAEQSVADPQVLGLGYELNAIAAAVVGGASLQGGVGTVLGTVLGAVFLRTVVYSVGIIIKTGADIFEGSIVGILVVAAVALSQWRSTRGQGNRFFAGPLAWVVIPTLALLAGMLSGFLQGHLIDWRVVGGVLGLLIAAKVFESRGGRASH